MKKNNILIVVFLLLFLAAELSSFSEMKETKERRITIAGIVVDSKEQLPLTGAVIEDETHHVKTKTDNKGFYTLSIKERGKLLIPNVLVSKKGFEKIPFVPNSDFLKGQHNYIILNIGLRNDKDSADRQVGSFVSIEKRDSAIKKTEILGNLHKYLEDRARILSNK